MFQMPARRSARRPTKAAAPPIGSDRTRSKLVEAAGEIFGELGFHHATVRQICDRAGTNIASVNYHFGNKTGLYTEVVRRSMRAARLDQVRDALDQQASPDEILRSAVKARLESLWGQDLEDWHFRIIMHELAKPTPAMNQVVTEAIRPVYARLRELLGRILRLPPDHEKTRLCAHSIMGQIMFYAFARPVIARLWPEMKLTSPQVTLVANHIADFSLAYLRAAASDRRRDHHDGRAKRKIQHRTSGD
jgi:TetR/AcrR family transcriptional regulator, regulator of cefoperazone and chloramphenicol sensitivity